MTKRAKLYIAATFMTGLAVLVLAATHWRTSDSARFLCYLSAALLGSMLKLRLPKLTSTISPGFLFVLIAVADFSFSETVIMACASALVQCVCNVKRRPGVVQILFNIATLAIASGLASASHLALGAAHKAYLPVLMAVAACILYGANTLLVSIVLALVEQQPFRQACWFTHLYAIPYYLIGSVFAALNSASSQIVGWGLSLLILPGMYLVSNYYRRYLRQIRDSLPGAQLLR